MNIVSMFIVQVFSYFCENFAEQSSWGIKQHIWRYWETNNNARSEWDEVPRASHKGNTEVVPQRSCDQQILKQRC